MAYWDGYKGQYMVAVGEAMKTMFPVIQSKYPWIVGHHHIGSFTGSPEDMWIYYYPDTRKRKTSWLTDKVVAEIRRMTFTGLLEVGYPEAALGTLKLNFPTKEEIDEAGGEYNFFR